jgi:hypothetical protein
MGLIIMLLVLVGLAAIFVWVADWACVGELLNRRLAATGPSMRRSKSESASSEA